MRRHAMLLLTCFALAPLPRPLHAATVARELGVFSERGMVWRADDGEEARPRRFSSSRRGLELDCPFSRIKERRFWDIATRVPVAGCSSFSLALRVSNPSAVRRVSVYFRSGAGWYAAWIAPGDGQWQQITLSRRDFTTEGAAAGWDRVSGMRISVWKATDMDTQVELANLEGHQHEIVIIRNAMHIAAGATDAWAVKRHVRLTYRWLSEAGIDVGQLDDSDLRAGLPKNTKLAILPYNPLLDAAQLQALDLFCQRGGRLIAMQSGVPDLLRLLGLVQAPSRKATVQREFATIEFSGWVSGGLPPSIPQGNELALLPVAGDATVIGYWRDAAGHLSDWPAATIHPNGAYLGAWLTEGGREAKTRLLLALIGKLRPDIATPLAMSLLDSAQRLLGAEDWDGTRHLIEAAARESGRVRRIAPYLAEIEAYRQRVDAAVTDKTFPALAHDAEVLLRMVRKAYASAVGPAADELRAVWCHRAHGVDGLPWGTVAQRVKRAGLDTIVPNMAWAGRAYYPSKVLPTMDGPDRLRECLAACKAEDLALQVWFVCFNLEGADETFVARMRREGRLQMHASGTARNWLCPSAPANRKLHVEAVAEMARNYPIDGVMLDYIRYPNADSCYCEGCRARFEASVHTRVAKWPAGVRGGPLQGRYMDWRRVQISSLVAEIRRTLRRVRPTAELSAAVYRGWPGCREGMGQDWMAWLERGDLDFACPMDYEQDHAAFEKLVGSQLAALPKGGRLYPGVGVTYPGLAPEETVHQVRLLRRAGANGFILFDLERDLLDQHLPLLRDGATSTSGDAR